MKDRFKDFSSKQDMAKVRSLFIAAAICSPIFYFFMQSIEVGSEDNFFFRMIITLIGVLGLCTTFRPHVYQKTMINIFITLTRVSYLALYLYLLQVNHWTIYQRWSYFVLAFIMCGSAFSWKDYIGITSVSIFSPIIMGFFSHDISALELVHFHAANIAPIIIIGFSIRAHYHFKNEVGILTNNLIEKSQITVLSEVAAGVSHEVNSPLMILSHSFHQLNRNLNQDVIDREKVKLLTDKMYRMIERISNIVNALKVYAIEESDEKFENTDMIKLIDEVLKLCKRKFVEQGITVYAESQETKVICHVKKSQIIQCLLNLLTNAAEACHATHSPQIFIETSINEKFVMIAISDSGKGVPDDVADKIMHPFFTTKEIGVGTGLGLSVSQGIARGHKGDLSLDKTLSPSTFVLKLPLA